MEPTEFDATHQQFQSPLDKPTHDAPFFQVGDHVFIQCGDSKEEFIVDEILGDQLSNPSGYRFVKAIK